MEVYVFAVMVSNNEKHEKLRLYTLFKETFLFPTQAEINLFVLTLSLPPPTSLMH